MAELVDALDLGSSAARRGGSSPFTRTFFYFIIRIRPFRLFVRSYRGNFEIQPNISNLKTTF